MDVETDSEFDQINQLYDECLDYLKSVKFDDFEQKVLLNNEDIDPGYEIIKYVDFDNVDKNKEKICKESKLKETDVPNIDFKVENELISNESLNSIPSVKSERLRRLSQQLPKIIITQSNTSLSLKKEVNENETRKDQQYVENHIVERKSTVKKHEQVKRIEPPLRYKAFSDYPKRLVSKNGAENIALISNVPFEKIRLLNDTFHTLINLRWRWIVIGTVVVHFTIWLVFAVFWYITALAHYDFEPEPPKRACVTGGKDFVTIFLASVEAQMALERAKINDQLSKINDQRLITLINIDPEYSRLGRTTIGFGDRAIDEECPESIFLFIMQLILGTGLSGVLTCVVYAKLTRPEKLSRDGVGFSKKAVICMRDGKLCLMIRAWDLNYDHIISSEFTAHFINTHRTKEGEVIRYYAQSLPLQQRQFLLWPVTLVHEIDEASPLYTLTSKSIAECSFEITISLKGASASMGTFTQSQTSYLPREIVWGYRFPTVVKYDTHKQKYVIDHSKLNTIEPVHTPSLSACELYSKSNTTHQNVETTPGTPGSFSDKVSRFQIGRTSSFRRRERRN